MLTAGVAVTCLTIGLVFTTGAGEYWLTLFDSFGATGLTFIAFTELVSVMYVYGHEKFTRDITVMTGVRPGLFWQITWRSVLLIMTMMMTMMMSRFVSPALMAGIILSSLYFMMSHWPTYTAWDRATATGVRVPYPAWTMGVAAILATSSLVPIICGMVRANQSAYICSLTQHRSRRRSGARTGRRSGPTSSTGWTPPPAPGPCSASSRL